jgi:hypothetical protein
MLPHRFRFNTFQYMDLRPLIQEVGCKKRR